MKKKLSPSRQHKIPPMAYLNPTVFECFFLIMKYFIEIEVKTKWPNSTYECLSDSQRSWIYKKTNLWFKVKNPNLGNIEPYILILYGREKKLLQFIKSSPFR